jgi:thiamine-phosphate pyrophosphorylase
MGRELPRLYLLFTPTLCRGEPWHTLGAALAGGVDLVQWRVKAPDPDGLDRCLAACRRAGVPVIVNDDPVAAVEHGAAGAHVGQTDIAASEARRVLGPRRWLGVSTHDLIQLAAAEEAGADYVGFGPCFPTATKSYGAGLGAAALGAALTRARVPVFAIGGVDASNLAELTAVGCTRVAVSRAILDAGDPRRAAAELRRRLG